MTRRDLLTKIRDMMTEIEKMRRIPNSTNGQRAYNENGRIGGRKGITAPGNDPDAPYAVIPYPDAP